MATLDTGSVSTVQGCLIVVYNCGAGGSTLAWRIGEVDVWSSEFDVGFGNCWCDGDRSRSIV